jgi:hypothetical protein
LRDVLITFIISEDLLLTMSQNSIVGHHQSDRHEDKKKEENFAEFTQQIRHLLLHESSSSSCRPRLL